MSSGSKRTKAKRGVSDPALAKAMFGGGAQDTSKFYDSDDDDDDMPIASSNSVRTTASVQVAGVLRRIEPEAPIQAAVVGATRVSKDEQYNRVRNQIFDGPDTCSSSSAAQQRSHAPSHEARPMSQHGSRPRGEAPAAKRTVLLRGNVSNDAHEFRR